jgi:hypothetical protein
MKHVQYDILVVCFVVKGDRMTSVVLEDGNKEMFSKKWSSNELAIW